MATATGAHSVHPPSFGPAIHSLPRTAPGSVAGVDVVEAEVVVFGVPMVVVLVTVVLFPETVVELDVVTPVLLLTVLLVVVLVGVLDITALPLPR